MPGAATSAQPCGGAGAPGRHLRGKPEAAWHWTALAAQAGWAQRLIKNAVIPGRREASNPESRCGINLWIPGSGLRPAPE
jgi:hypothetical protein